MSEFGTSSSAIDKIFHVPDHGFPNPKGYKPLNVSQKAHQFQVQQTQGQELQALGDYIICFFQDKLKLENVPTTSLNTPTFKWPSISRATSLKAWTTELFIDAGQQAYFGDALAAIDPGLPQALIELDDLSWQVFYQYPRWLRPKVNRLSARIRRSLETYFELPLELRPAQAWFTQALEREYRDAGLDNKDIAAQMLFLYWG